MEIRRVPKVLALVAILALALSSSARAQESGPSQPATKAPAQPPTTAPQTQTASAKPPSDTAGPVKAERIEVRTGTHLPLVLHNGISTRTTKPGDPVYFETLFPIMVDGKVVIPAGSYVSGEVTEAKRAGRVKGRAEIMLRLNTLILPNAYQVSLGASPGNAGTGGGESVNNEGKIKGDTDKASDVGTVVKTTGAGGGIGAIAGGAKGAGIGAGIGAAAGLAAVLLTRGPDAELPRGTTLEAVLDHPLFLEADRVQFTSPGQSSTLAGPPNREAQRNKVPF
jgi:hypothetical protein